MLVRTQGISLGVLIVALIGSRAWGASPSREGAEFYQRGVRAYFAGNYDDADRYLSLALTHRPEDPRAYYFRALALERLGRVDEARGDIMLGAAYEAAHPQRYDVGGALMRVQGGARLKFEQLRQETRRNAIASAPRVQLARYEAARYNDEAYLRRPVVVSLEEFLPEADRQRLNEMTYPEEPPGRMPAARNATPQAAALGTLPDEESSDVAGGNPFADDPVEASAEDDRGTAGAIPAPADSDGDVFGGAQEEVESASRSADGPAGEAGEATSTEEDPFGDL